MLELELQGGFAERSGITKIRAGRYSIFNLCFTLTIKEVGMLVVKCFYQVMLEDQFYPSLLEQQR